MFSSSRPYDGVILPQQSLCSRLHRLKPLLCGIRCVLCYRRRQALRLDESFLQGVPRQSIRHAIALFMGVDPYGRGGTCLPIFMKGGTSIVMSPNILEVMSFRMSTRVTTTVVCCILTQILGVVSQKNLQLLGDFVPQTPYRGSAPGRRWGTSVPQTPSPFLCPPNNPERSTPLAFILYQPKTSP